MRERTGNVLWLLLPALLAACATGSGSRRAPARTIFMEPLHLGLQPDAELGLADFDGRCRFTGVSSRSFPTAVFSRRRR